MKTIKNLKEAKEKVAIIYNTKDIENIKEILSYGELGENILEVLRFIEEITIAK